MVILTALRLEYDAMLRHLAHVEQRENDAGTVFDVGRLRGTGWRAALALIGQGNIAAAVITEQARAMFRPAALLFVGVAGSLKDDVEIGDVVIGTHIYAYHSEKHDPGVSLARPRVWETPHWLMQRAMRVAEEPGFRVHHKPIAAGEVVLNDPRSPLKEQLAHHYSDAVAIEMESAGVSQAAHVSRMQTLTIRGISDKADGRKHAADAAGKQRMAAEHAALVAVAVLREVGQALVLFTPWGGTPVGAFAEVADRPPAGAPTAGAPTDRRPAGVVHDVGNEIGNEVTDEVPPAVRLPDAAVRPTAVASGTGGGTGGTGGDTGGTGGTGAAGAAGHGPAAGTGDAGFRSSPAPVDGTPPPADAGPRTVGDGPFAADAGTEPARGTGPRGASAGGGSRADDAGAAPGAGTGSRGARAGTPRTDGAAASPSPTASTSPAASASPGIPLHPGGAAPGTASGSAAGGAAPTADGEAPRPRPGRRPAKPSGSGTFRLLSRPFGSRRSATATVLGVAAAVTALVLALLPSGGSDDGEDGVRTTKAGSALAPCPAAQADVTLRIAASVDLSTPLGDAATGYGARRSDGHCVKVVVAGVNSGTGMRALSRGWSEDDGPTPDVWSPAGRDWLALARSRATPQALKVLPETAEPIVTSPLTIAMPKKMAQALGWPEQRIGWKDLARWAQDPKNFWAERGQRQWGALKLGKTNPNYSTSGLNATVGAFYARTGTSAELSVKDIDDPDNQALVRDIEKSVVHYGDDTLTFLSNLRAADDHGGPDEALDYISAVTVEEAAVVAYNQGYPCGSYSTDGTRGCARTSPPTTPLVSLYPKDSNPESDHPYVVLNGLPAPKQTVAADFLAHLHTRAVFDRYFAPYGFRTHDRLPGSEVTTDNGALPDTELSPYRAPQGPVLDRIQQAWSRLRRPANVLVVIDTSLSMEDKVPGTGRTKMELLKEAEPALFGGFGDADRVGLWRFSNAANIDGEHHYQSLVPIGPMSAGLAGGGSRREQLTKEVKGLVPNGATGLYGTVDAALATLRGGYAADSINALVLLTDGRNEGVPDTPTLDDVLARIDGMKEQIRIFTIAYGSEADEQDAGGRTVLEKIAAAGGGRAYKAQDPKVISDVLTSVISNF